MTDAEQIEAWRSEFEKFIPNANLSKYPEGDYVRDPIDAMWRGFQLAKRSQPVIELPEPDHYSGDSDHYYAKNIHLAITAAGYKFTIGE